MIKSHPHLYAATFGIAALLLAACGPGENSQAPAAPANEAESNALSANAAADIPANAVAETPAAAISPTPEASPFADATPKVPAAPSPTPSPVQMAAAAPVPVEAPAAFAMCKGCHTVNKGGGALVGPNLHGVVGAAAGTKPGYAYSDAMKSAGLRWNRANLDAFLADPSGRVPGTKMGLPGNKDAAQRKAIIDYLETLK